MLKVEYITVWIQLTYLMLNSIDVDNISYPITSKGVHNNCLLAMPSLCMHTHLNGTSVMKFWLVLNIFCVKKIKL